MLKIDVITVGKLKEGYLRSACEEYLKRLSLYAKVQVLELSEYKDSAAPYIQKAPAPVLWHKD